MKSFISQANKLPSGPGIYYFSSRDELLYIGKANNIKARVKSYILKAHNIRLEKMLSQVEKIDYRETKSAVEALILEAEEIKKKQPPLNIKLKDDKTFLGVYITKENFPRVIAARLTKTNLPPGTFYGPYTSAKTLRSALKIIRKIFPYCEDPRLRDKKQPCFYYHLDQCPGVCTGEIDRFNYRKNINHLRLFLKGRKKSLLTQLKKSMNEASLNEEFRLAGMYKKQIISLSKIHDASLEISDTGPVINDSKIRIEGYDISNIQGKLGSGSMVVMDCYGLKATIRKDQYRRFSIRTKDTPDDNKMLEEVLIRRFKHPEWDFPSAVLIDGGKGQLNTARKVLKIFNLDIPIVSMSKGPTRKRTDLHGDVSKVLEYTSIEDLVFLRDESHRFAVAGYRVRHKNKLID